MQPDGQNKSLTIGVPVHNEEEALPTFFENLVHAIQELPRNVDVEVIFCVNGCTDSSEALLREQTRNSSRIADMKIIESEPGKMNAQVAIVNAREYDGPMCFADADIAMTRPTLKALYNTIESAPDCQVAYSRVEPFYDKDANGSETAFNDLLFTHYKYREHQPQRSYFHGRTFMMRDDSYLRDMGLGLDERIERVREEEDPWYMDNLGIEKGPMIDDIYLSRAIVFDHGAEAITEVPGATVYFNPPTSIEDYSRVLERTASEIKRLDLLYPEHAELQDSVFKREFNDANLYMPQGERLKYRMLQDLERTLKRHIDAAITPPDQKEGALFGVSHWLRAGTTKGKILGRDQLAQFHKPYSAPGAEIVSKPPTHEGLGHQGNDYDEGPAVH